MGRLGTQATKETGRYCFGRKIILDRSVDGAQEGSMIIGNILEAIGRLLSGANL